MKRFKTVIIGMGRMGRTRYENMKKHGGFDITGLCDTNKNLLEQYPEKTYENWRECIDREKADIVVVCTFNSVIADVVCYALEKGCHVFSEKPPGKTLEDTLRMQTCYENHQEKVLKYGFNHRYHYSVIEAKSLIDSGFLGDVVAVRGVYGKAGNLENYEWRNMIDLAGGGILLDQGIHMLDLLRYFCGDFVEVNSICENLVWKESVGEDTAFITLRSLDNKIATLHSSAIQWKHKFDMDIICTNGYIALNGLLTSTKSYGEERISYYRKDLELKSGKLGNPTEYTMCFDEDHSWEYEIKEFYNAITSNGNILNGTIDDAVAVMKLIDIVYKN